ncbi:hypothetical protein J6590_005265 [Homalodisca vitripennis]|nr:hypothetical protein J6590_005265 [Homalodisca vitripennis]
MVYYTYMVPKPKPMHNFWIIIRHLVEKPVWIILFSTFTLVYFVVWYSTKSNINNTNFSGAIKIILTLVGILIASTSHVPSSVRFVHHIITSWSILGFFICSIFSNTILSRLMVAQYSSMVNSVEDIVHGNFYWGFPGYDNQSQREAYFNLQDQQEGPAITNSSRSLAKKAEGQYQNITSNTSRDALHSGNFVFPIQKLGHEYAFLDIDGLKPSDLKGFRVMKQTLNQFYVSVVFSRYSMYLEVFYEVLRRFLEMGLVIHWKRDVILHYGLPEIQVLVYEFPTEAVMDEFKPLTFSNTLVGFNILVAGWFLAVVVFVFELFNR